MPNVTRTLGVTTETVCVWRVGSVMDRPARQKKEEDVSRLVFCYNFCISKCVTEKCKWYIALHDDLWQVRACCKATRARVAKYFQ